MHVLESSRADATDLVVSKSQLFKSSWQSTGHRFQVVVVGKEVAQLGLVLQGSLVQFATLQLVVVQDEPSEISNAGQNRGGQG